MPVYTYKFPDGTVVEEEQSIHDDPHAFLYHPELNVPQEVRRVPVVPSIVLKGDGFARNDR